MTKISQRKLCCIVLFSVIVIYRLLSFIINGRMILISDELGTLIPAATLAGRDWSGISSILAYYGFGYSSLLFPIFMITSNPYVIYWSIMVIGAILLGISAVICFHILRKYLKIKNNKLCFIISVVSNLLCLTDMKYINNEPMVVLILWSLVWLMFIINKHSENENRKLKRIYSFIFTALLMYSITVHARLTAVIISTVIFVIIYYWVYRKWFFSLEVVIPSSVIFYLLSKQTIAFAQNKFWTTSAGSSDALHNSAESTANSITSTLKVLNNPEQWKSIAYCIIGNIYVTTFFTAGIFCFIIVFLIKYFFLAIFKRKIFVSKNENLINKNMFAAYLFISISLVVTLVGLILLWTPLVTKGRELGHGANTTALKVWVFIRYYSPFVGIIFAFFLSHIYIDKKILKKLVIPSSVVYAVTALIWYIYMVPFIKNSNIIYNVFGPFKLVKSTDDINILLYRIVLILSTISFIILCYCYRYNRKNLSSYKLKYIPILIAGALIAVRFYYNSALLQSPNDEKGDGAYSIISEVKSKFDLPNDIYLLALDSYTYPYQFYLNEYTLNKLEELPSDCSYPIIFTNNAKFFSDAGIKNYSYIKLDNNEYMFVTGEELINNFKNNGYNLKSLQ